jgi:2-isopropylmalate synthase
MNSAEKMRLTTQLKKLGVDVLEAGFPASSEGDLNAVSMIAGKLKKTEIAALARTLYNKITRGYTSASYYKSSRLKLTYLMD